MIFFTSKLHQEYSGQQSKAPSAVAAGASAAGASEYAAKNSSLLSGILKHSGHVFRYLLMVPYNLLYLLVII